MRGKANLASRLQCVLLMLVVARTAAAGEVIYVDADATGVNNGSSWANAHWCLQDALADAQSGDEIRVAQGIYKPDREVVTGRNTQIVASGDRTATFQLKNGVTIKGGYAGFGEPNPDAQDTELYETILSGDLDGDDGPDFTNNSENSYHVVAGSRTSPTEVDMLAGFTITGGNADGPPPHDRGGGMFNHNHSDASLINCTFSANTAADSGGIGNALESNPTLTNCIVWGNLAIGAVNESAQIQVVSLSRFL